MTSLEFNKIAAAILATGVIAMTSGFVADLLLGHHELKENIYMPAATAVSEEPGTEPGPGMESVLPLIQTADVAAGQKVAKKCAACHTFDNGGANKIGPNLWNIVNRPIASVAGFTYSGALQGMSNTDWTYKDLDSFLINPKNYAPGTKMAFAGVRKLNSRADLIAYLRSLSDAPAPLPEGEVSPTSDGAIEVPAEPSESPDEPASEPESPDDSASSGTAGGTQVAATGGDGLGALLAAADPAAGKKVARKCSACHTFNAGGKNKIGPNLHNIVGSAIAANADFKYSDALMGKSGETWTYETLDDWLKKPKDWAPGNKMVFPGLRKPKDRAAVIVYMRSETDNPPPLPE